MDASRIAQRFPLVPRPRPLCRPLPERVQEVRLLDRKGGELNGLSSAAAALNRAALIASDCGMPDLARELCWLHANVYLRARPLDAPTARLALEPLVNLARLFIRAGNGEEAYQLLYGLNQAVQDQNDITMDGRLVPASDLLRSDQDPRPLGQWLWSVLLGDGTRALVAAQQWTRALTHVRDNKGVGRRLLDGRQVEIIATCLSGDPAAAQQTVLDSTPSESWEDAVASCLAALCLSVAREDLTDASKRAAQAFMCLEPIPELAVFRTRIGLTAIAFADEFGREPIARRLVSEATHGADGYVATEVLADATCAAVMSNSERDGVIAAIDAAGLATGFIPRRLEQTLLGASDVAIRTIAVQVGIGHPGD